MNQTPLLPEEDSASLQPSFNSKKILRITGIVVLAGILMGSIILAGKKDDTPAAAKNKGGDAVLPVTDSAIKPEAAPGNNTAGGLLDTALYNKQLAHMANGDSTGRWPVKSVYPNAGALLPFNRIIAYYGNLYSKGMGILGELPPKQMLDKLQEEVKKWQMADSAVKVIPALHYIAITAQKQPGKAGHYILRMPFHQIDSVLSMARQIGAIVFLDIQIGGSTLEREIPMLDSFLRMPNVHLGIDPEFSMKQGAVPGKKVGTFDASEINFASDHLAKLVRDNHLTPKILIIHRFTQGMLTNYHQIKTKPEVQLVVDMDGWGFAAKKINTYQQFVHREPVQFTGFKLFYKNDTKNNGSILTPHQLLQLKPQPVYIQYQ